MREESFMITEKSDHIRIEGHRGTWYVIDEGWFILTPDTDSGQPLTIPAHLFLLEHEVYGDEAACLIVDEHGTIVLEDVWNGFDDLEDAGWARPRVALYSRVDRGGSEEGRAMAIEAQRSALKEFAAAHSMEIAGEYIDNGFAGNDTERPSLKKLMEDAGKEFDAVLVVKMSRLSRPKQSWPFPVISLNPLEQ